MIRPFVLSFAVACVVACASACSESSSSTAIGNGSVDAGDASSKSDALADVAVAASEYCESVAGAFCAFYLRCGRMAVRDEAECKTVFLETCNARYEPRYADLERASLLTLSKSGIEACSAHLASVACEAQPLDLNGPCATMWRGDSEVGQPCAIDVESFVCGPRSTCILGLNFCGKCEASADRGDTCGNGVRCSAEDACIDGTCQARRLPGESCDDTSKCLTGSTCTNGKCVAPTWVGVGEACDTKRRCAYHSFCENGKCTKGSLLGESCTTDRACDSGRCSGGKCVALRAVGESCSAPAECTSGSCVQSKCASLPSACFSQ